MKNIAIVSGAFHQEQVNQMLEEARSVAAELGLKIVEEVTVPGSLEKPLALKRLLMKDNIDGVVVLGIIERGETKNGFVMGQAFIHATVQLQLEFMKPIGVGIVGPEVLPSQIPSRLKPFAKKAVVAVNAMLS